MLERLDQAMLKSFLPDPELWCVCDPKEPGLSKPDFEVHDAQVLGELFCARTSPLVKELQSRPCR